ncbi:MAG: DUF6968 family protein [Kiritimatiellia bacterium]|jgi:hypothetical protein
MREPIAEMKLVMKSPDGVSTSVHVEIGRPYTVSAEEAACPVAMSGLLPRISDIHGIDAFQALDLALEFVKTTIQAWETKGFAFAFPDGSTLPATAGLDSGKGEMK